MMTRNGKRMLQEEESQNESKCTKCVNVRMDPEISAQLAKIDEHIESESQKVKKGKKTLTYYFSKFPDNSKNNIFQLFQAETQILWRTKTKKIVTICRTNQSDLKIFLQKFY